MVPQIRSPHRLKGNLFSQILTIRTAIKSKRKKIRGQDEALLRNFTISIKSHCLKNKTYKNWHQVP
jgi:hypothetical protein